MARGNGTSPRRAGRAAVARAAVTVDVAILTIVDGEDGPVLAVLEARRDDGPGWRLPGAPVAEGEALRDAAVRVARDQAGVTGRSPDQVQVTEDVESPDLGRVLAVGHAAVVPSELVDNRPEGTRLAPAANPGRLPAGQAELLARTVAGLQERYRREPDPDGFLPDRFTLRELRLVHEAVAGRPLQRDTFRRAMQEGLAATGRVVVGVPGRPAELFRRA